MEGIRRISGIVTKDTQTQRALTAEDVIDGIQTLLPNARMAVVLLPTAGQGHRVAIDPAPKADVERLAALNGHLIRWIAQYTTMHAPKVPSWLRAALPVDRVVVVPIRWRDWVAGAIVLEADWLEREHVEALKDYCTGLAVRIATEDWMSRSEQVSGVLRPVPLAEVG